jgi:glutamate-1-semialdehyde 2,1-aminomutase
MDSVLGKIMSNIQTDLFTKAKTMVPGGVHSPVRSFKGLHTTPRFFKEASGAYITDVEDKNYIDFCMSFGPMILGHRNPKVEKALQEGLTRGWSFGACRPAQA